MRVPAQERIYHQLRWDAGLEGIFALIQGEYDRSTWPWGEGFYECDCGAVFYVSDCDPSVLDDMGLGRTYTYGDRDDPETDFMCAKCWADEERRYAESLGEGAVV